MEVHFTPEMEKRIKDFSAETGRSTDDLVQDAIAGYFEELRQTQEMLDSRYDDLKSGRVKPINGEEFFENLRRREEGLLKKRSPR
jgi:predicted DNA-binding protein